MIDSKKTKVSNFSLTTPTLAGLDLAAKVSARSKAQLVRWLLSVGVSRLLKGDLNRDLSLLQIESIHADSWLDEVSRVGLENMTPTTTPTPPSSPSPPSSRSPVQSPVQVKSEVKSEVEVETDTFGNPKPARHVIEQRAAPIKQGRVWFFPVVALSALYRVEPSAVLYRIDDEDQIVHQGVTWINSLGLRQMRDLAPEDEVTRDLNEWIDNKLST